MISYFEPHSRHLLNVYHVLFLTQVAFPSVSPFSQPCAAGAAVTLILQVRRLRPRVKITQPRQFGELADPEAHTAPPAPLPCRNGNCRRRSGWAVFWSRYFVLSHSFSASQVLPISRFSPPVWWAALVVLLLIKTHAGFTDLLMCPLMKPWSSEPVCAQRSRRPWKMGCDRACKALGREEMVATSLGLELGKLGFGFAIRKLCHQEQQVTYPL